MNGVKYLQKIMGRIMGLCLSILWMLAATALAMPDTMSTDEIYPGMSGTAYTIVDSSGQIVSFDVSIVGVLDEGKGSSKMIMARASGPVVEQTGGVLQGMSGSPVYVDGRLIGALAAGMKETDPFTFFIRPIDDMLQIWNMPDSKNKTTIKQVDFKQAAAIREKAQRDAEKAAAKDAEAKDKDAKTPAETEKASPDSSKAADTAVVSDKSNTSDTQAQELPAQPENDPAAAESKTDKVSAASDAENQAGPADNVPVVAAGQEKAAVPESGKNEDSPSTAAQSAALASAQPKDVLYFAGFGDAGYAYMKKQLEPLGVEVSRLSGLSGGSTGQVSYHADLQPGGAVGVAVVYGDFLVGATGTVTAVEGNRMLAFGHSFLHKGNVNYFMTDASVVGSLSGAGSGAGMKFANVGNIIGRVSQDREAGIAGEVGVFPSVVPVRVTVNDRALSRSDTFAAQIAYDEDFLPSMSAGIAYAAMDKTADSLAGSTARVHFEVRTNAADNGKVERNNMYYNAADVGQVSFNELAQVMSLICSNTDKESDIFDVKVDVNIDSGRRTASLISAVPDKARVKPGDTVKFKTTIKPYRQAREVLTIPYTVPRNQPAGMLHLELRGGGLIPNAQLMLIQQATAAGVDFSTDEDKSQSTAAKLKEFLSLGKNNEIVITAAGSSGVVNTPAPENEVKTMETAEGIDSQDTSSHATASDKKAVVSSRETKFATNYIIDNIIHANLQVERK